MNTKTGMLAAILQSLAQEAERQGMSHKEWAFRASLAPAALSRIKKRGTADFESVARLAQALGRKIVDVPDDDYLHKLVTGTLINPEDL